MRYIDADALIKKIYPMGIGDGMYTINAKAVKFAIDNTPTADVVPKSEVEFLRKTIAENAQRSLEVALEEIEKAKAEVAREIFEEIENKLTEEAKDILERINSITDPDAVDGLYEEEATLKTVLAWLTELKKKYTEEKNDG